MAKYNTSVKGTADVLPQDSYKWQFVEKKMLETLDTISKFVYNT